MFTSHTPVMGITYTTVGMLTARGLQLLSRLRASTISRHSYGPFQQGDWQQHRAQNWQSEHRNWQQRGGYNGYRAPDNDYGSYYGPDHYFRVSSLPFRVEGGYPSFQYSGRWFSMVDPYPEYWGNTWYQTDDVYVAYFNDGYYLYNRMYPNSEGVAINISF